MYDFYSHEWKKKREQETFMHKERELHAASRHKSHGSLEHFWNPYYFVIFIIVAIFL